MDDYYQNDDKDLQTTQPQQLQPQTGKTPEDLETYQKWAASVGRPKKVTPQVIARVAYYLKQGNSMNDSCVLAGIGKTALYANLKQNENYRTIIAEAWTKNKQTHIRRIDEASKKDAKFSQWYLERRYPNEFGRSDKLDIKGNIENKTIITFDRSGYQPPLGEDRNSPVVFEDESIVIVDEDWTGPIKAGERPVASKTPNKILEYSQQKEQ